MSSLLADEAGGNERPSERRRKRVGNRIRELREEKNYFKKLFLTSVEFTEIIGQD
jgi:hypothetical protein